MQGSQFKSFSAVLVLYHEIADTRYQGDIMDFEGFFSIVLGL